MTDPTIEYLDIDNLVDLAVGAGRSSGPSPGRRSATWEADGPVDEGDAIAALGGLAGAGGGDDEPDHEQEAAEGATAHGVTSSMSGTRLPSR